MRCGSSLWVIARRAASTSFSLAPVRWNRVRKKARRHAEALRAHGKPRATQAERRLPAHAAVVNVRRSSALGGLEVQITWHAR
ncbi:hypothetical protein EN871_21550 [bacterium M00.F.Ca.ET.228.01.1.1]|nr:hypothetical protein EN871_21550 [bacterium M00.F.Ca.ET.228.01.1.1]TGR99561.1 hypothetical protein EN834_19735 [bacterium M00.F.Ca.ET.191.01.1.1]TGU03928.1 hypothetical protein EN798_20555 [bacterium M00.F.Ca.ET.155.01.1.1]